MSNIEIEQNTSKSDIIGAFASTLCLIHCVATPFIFVAGATSTGLHHHHHGDSPFWWSMIDIIFIVISFFAVYFSVKQSSKNWVKIALVASWFLLTAFILNEKFEVVHLAEFWVYIFALTLVGLHLYNRKYCHCKTDEACVIHDTKIASQSEH